MTKKVDVFEMMMAVATMMMVDLLMVAGMLKACWRMNAVWMIVGPTFDPLCRAPFPCWKVPFRVPFPCQRTLFLGLGEDFGLKRTVVFSAKLSDYPVVTDLVSRVAFPCFVPTVGQLLLFHLLSQPKEFVS